MKYFAFLILLISNFAFGQDSTSMEQDTTSIIKMDMADVLPEFPGGDVAMMQFIQTHVTYPAIARENNIQGRVFVEFIVDTTGNLSNFKIVRSVSPELDDEVLRVVKKFPRFKPAMQNGRKVRVRYTVPVTFRMS